MKKVLTSDCLPVQVGLGLVRIAIKAMALAIMIIATLAPSSASAKYANQYNKLDLLQSESTQAVTICYYRPKVWMGPGQRGIVYILDGHVQCAAEFNFGVLYYFKHTYQ